MDEGRCVRQVLSLDRVLLSLSKSSVKDSQGSSDLNENALTC